MYNSSKAHTPFQLTKSGIISSLLRYRFIRTFSKSKKGFLMSCIHTESVLRRRRITACINVDENDGYNHVVLLTSYFTRKH